MNEEKATAPAAAPAVVRRQNIFEIGEEFLKICDQLEALDGDISDPDIQQAIIARMENNAEAEGNKIDGYLGLMGMWEMEAVAAAARAERWAKKMKVRAQRVEFFKGVLFRYLEKTGKSKITTPAGNELSIVGNGGKQPLWVDAGINVAKLPEKYHKKIDPQLDNDVVRRDLETQSPEDAAKNMPWAKLMPRGKRLVIKP